ncbi:hypothetical protein DI392_17440 [Vibrio albus]|jgi:hypothetical protein|uniref:Uncharacterized protein n=1 Tax=Vibrio albus TaxID=2200953 RepID=A0A2U3B601_9VIBR|nr:hypothetical protein [Vibrio albus]PWI32145.1 hypothetical protein DI392_17440 [Vibrio albus]
MYEWMWMFSGLSLNAQVAVVVAGIVIIGVFLFTLPFFYQLMVSSFRMFWSISEKVFGLCLEIITVPVYFVSGTIKSLFYNMTHKSPVIPIKKEPQTTETLYKVMLRQDKTRGHY